MNYSFEREISETERRIRAGGAAHPRTQRARVYLDLLVRADAVVDRPESVQAQVCRKGS